MALFASNTIFAVFRLLANNDITAEKLVNTSHLIINRRPKLGQRFYTPVCGLSYVRKTYIGKTYAGKSDTIKY